MRALLMTATLVVAGALSAGCGDDGGSSAGRAEASPSAATTTEFCTAYNSLYDAFPAGTQPTDKQAVAAIKDWAEEMTSTGTPQDMPADARKGFDLVTATVDKIQPDDSQAEIQKLSDDLTPDQQAQSQAFGAYATKTCPMQAPSQAPASPSPTQ
jgi:hypothetical protein